MSSLIKLLDTINIVKGSTEFVINLPCDITNSNETVISNPQVLDSTVSVQLAFDSNYYIIVTATNPIINSFDFTYTLTTIVGNQR